jgi:DNA (cytosine-5)-methyltransferase 1
MHKRLKHIELFAGCGGMSLGLEAAGFDLFMANELSPMAGETFAYNIIGEDLQDIANKKEKPRNVLWIKSNFESNKIKERLRENPFEISDGTYSDISTSTNFSGKLIIGNIDHFLQFLKDNQEVYKQLRRKNIDLLSGGPPCQGFSLAGKRIKDDNKNILPLSFAKFAGLVQPKVVLLENVKGITSPFTTEDGVKHFAWLEVAKAFALEGFYPICMLVNSKYFGVPQNRPRFILFALRKDIFNKLRVRKGKSNQASLILDNTNSFYKEVNEKRNCLDEIKKTAITLYNIETSQLLFNGELLPKITKSTNDFIQAHEAIGDLMSVNSGYSLKDIENDYSLRLSKIFKTKFCFEGNELLNHEFRNHSFNVRARFRLYQVLSNSNGFKQEAMSIISGVNDNQEILEKVYTAFKEEKLLFISDGGVEVLKKPDSLNTFKEYIKQIGSRKHSQRAIKFDEPAPAQMTIPDDLCHYSSSELRTLTVREMARWKNRSK